MNTAASTAPNTIRADTGQVLPSNVWNFGADWTPTSKLVVTGRFGYFFNNAEDRGRPTGVQYAYQSNLLHDASDPTKVTLGLNGQPLVPVGSSLINTAGFTNIGSNFATLFDAYKRKAVSTDASYYVGKFLGTHNFKVGYALNRLSNDVTQSFNTAQVLLFYGQDYSVAT